MTDSENDTPPPLSKVPETESTVSSVDDVVLKKRSWLYKLKLLFSPQRSSILISHILGEKNYVLILAVAAGLLAGLAAVILRNFAEQVREFTETIIPGDLHVWLFPALPAVGIFFTIMFARFFAKGHYDKSLCGVIVSTSNGTSDIPVQKTYSHLLTSGVSVGCGVSAGLEAPIALTGSAIGSNIAKFFKLGRETRTLLLACGGGAGISAVFNSPVAGALFACEILLPSFSIPALIPLLMASASAAVVTELLDESHIFTMEVTSWSMANIPYYVLLGILCGMISSFVIKTSTFITAKFEKFNNVWIRGLAGAIVLYGTFLLFPVLRAEGYPFVNKLIQSGGAEMTIMDGSPIESLFTSPWIFLAMIAFLVLAKSVVSCAGLESGGDGGMFAPSMFTGAFLGFFLARFIRMSDLIGSAGISEHNFIAVGMGGVLAGVMHAPMTGMFLIAEIIGGYKLFIPLMIVASLSCYVCRKFAPFNIYKTAIAVRGGSPEHNTHEAVLETITVGDMVENDFIPVRQDDTLRTLLGAIMKSKRNVFPVLDTEDALVGIVTLDNVRKFLLDDQLYDVVLVYDIMRETGPILDSGDSLADAAKLFEACRLWNLPVIREGKYLGFVSKSGVFDKYRSMLKDKHELF